MESIKEMLDRMTDMKITDPQVLLKLYNLYRYRILDDYENEDETYVNEHTQEGVEAAENQWSFKINRRNSFYNLS